MSGDTIVVGAFGDNADTGGTAYIYERKDGKWGLATTLISPDAALAGNQYGRVVAATTDLVVVGAPAATIDVLTGAGSAYLYERVADVWQQVVAPAIPGPIVGAAANARMGCAVSARGNVLATTACAGSVIGNGDIQLYERVDNVWQTSTTILASNTAGVVANDLFGTAIAVGKDVIVIGAPEDDGKGDKAGAAYLFEKDATGIWQQTAKLVASDGLSGDLFGSAVAADGDTVMIGASYNDQGGTNAGAVYIFERSGQTWPETAKLVASDADDVDFFGFSVAISGDQIAVGARRNDDVGEDSGAVYLYERRGGKWLEFGRMVAPDGKTNDGLGYGVAVDQSILVGTAYPETVAGGVSGSLYVFERGLPVP